MEKTIGLLWNGIERTVYKVLNVVFKLIKKELSEDVFVTIIQFIKFGIVGLSNTVISYVTYAISLLLFQKNDFIQKYDYLVAQVIAFILSVLWSFYWNSKKVFVMEEGKKRSIWSSLIKTFISYSITGLWLNSLLLFLWVNALGISEFIAPIINLVVSVPLNFIINKFWAFKQK